MFHLWPWLQRQELDQLCLCRLHRHSWIKVLHPKSGIWFESLFDCWSIRNGFPLLHCFENASGVCRDPINEPIYSRWILLTWFPVGSILFKQTELVSHESTDLCQKHGYAMIRREQLLPKGCNNRFDAQFQAILVWWIQWRWWMATSWSALSNPNLLKTPVLHFSLGKNMLKSQNRCFL